MRRQKANVRREMERITGSSRLDPIIPIDGPVSNEREKLEVVARSLGIDPNYKE